MMPKQQFVIFDLEYASWEGFLQAPAEEQKKAEVTQIAALKINADDLTVAAALNIYVKPKFVPKLTDYFIRLTGLTDELLAKEGIDFPSAYTKFKTFAGDCVCYSHGWGLPADHPCDGQVFGYNLDMHGIKDCAAPHYQNIAAWFAAQYETHKIHICRQCSGEIAKLLDCTENLPQGLDTHNALYDVYSILAGLKKFGFKA